MKTVFILIIAMLSLNGFSQKKEKGSIKIPKASFNKNVAVRDIIPGIPANCSISAMISLTVYGDLKSMLFKGDTISKSLGTMMKQSKLVYFEDVKPDCNATLERSYKINIE